MATGDDVNAIIRDRANERGQGGAFGLEPSTLTRIQRQALTEFNQHEPEKVVVVIPADTIGTDLNFTLPATWDPEISHIVKIQILLELNHERTLKQGLDYYTFEETTGVWRIRFDQQHGTDIRLITREPWTIDTIEANARALSKFGLLAAARVCFAKAALYADAQEGTLLADVVNRKSSAETWRSLGKDLLTEYEEVIKPPDSRKSAGQSIKFVDLSSGPGGIRRRRRMIHGPHRGRNL